LAFFPFATRTQSATQLSKPHGYGLDMLAKMPIRRRPVRARKRPGTTMSADAHKANIRRFVEEVQIGLMDIARLEEGKIVETWHVGDDRGMLQQLGAVQSPSR
jgi:predicted SnoaL-like aldol condensation-catalyzing enzyme